MYSHITEYNNQFQNYELLGVNQIFKLKFKLFHIKITKLSNIDVKFSFSEKPTKICANCCGLLRKAEL